ncbi:MAG: LLM class flavin-dependent oxidoreductase [Microbacterium sp.]
MKKIGFLSFGHWTNHSSSATRSASDVLLQSIDLAQAAEDVGADGAYFRVHHYAQQLSSPFPLLAAAGAKTNRIELGTGVIDMRYENPMYFVEDAAAADLISGGRLQLGVSRGSPEQVIDGWKYFGYDSAESDPTGANAAREKTLLALQLLQGARFAEPNPRPMFPNPPGKLGLQPISPGLRNRIWWGAGSVSTARWAAENGMNLMSSTLVEHESPKPFHVQQANQIRAYREEWAKHDHGFEPRVSVSRSIFALTNDLDRRYHIGAGDREDQIGALDDYTAIFGRSYVGEPHDLIAELAGDEAIAEADTVLLTVPNQLGVEYNAHVLESILTHVAPGLGWR